VRVRPANVVRETNGGRQNKWTTIGAESAWKKKNLPRLDIAARFSREYGEKRRDGEFRVTHALDNLTTRRERKTILRKHSRGAVTATVRGRKRKSLTADRRPRRRLSDSTAVAAAARQRRTLLRNSSYNFCCRAGSSFHDCALFREMYCCSFPTSAVFYYLFLT